MKTTRFTPILWACAVLALIGGAVSTGASANLITMADYTGGGPNDQISCNSLDSNACSGFIGILPAGPISLSLTDADRYAMPGNSNETSQLGLLNLLLSKPDLNRAAVSYVSKTDGDGNGFTTNRQYFSVKKSTGMWFFENLTSGTVTVNLEGRAEDYSNWTEYGSAVPVPAAFWLFGTALIGFIGFSRRTKV